MFFTDLDRTIIFSKRFVDEDSEHLIPVERKAERIISYMTPEAHNLLRIIHKHSSFIPVTARKLDEILRIGFVKDMLPEWMVCESGRVIYHKGERLEEWDEAIQRRLVLYLPFIEMAHEKFRYLLEDKLECKVWKINDEMIMSKTEGLPEEAFKELKNQESWFARHGCRLYLQQRKAYLIPTVISKENAIEFLINKLKPTVTISAGDAQMDAGMFEKTEYAIAPSHHTINDLAIPVTKETGLKAGENILQFAKEKLHLYG